MAVIAKIEGKYTTKIQARQHEILADEPVSLEGADKGMTPTELLAASLASCTGITMKMYAERKGWDIKIEVSVDATLDYKTNEAIFEKTISIKGDVTDSDKERLYKIASSCPVHKLLAKSNVINTTYN